MKQRNYQTNCLPAGSFAGRAMAQALMIALAILFVLSLTTPAAAQAAPYSRDAPFNTDDDPSIVALTFKAKNNPHGGIGAVKNGTANEYYYVAIKMTIEDTLEATQNYTFGQTGNDQQIDTVMLVYDEVFDPLSPETGLIDYDDDTGPEPGPCGTGSWCPEVTVDLAGKRNIILVISTYYPDEELETPQEFFAEGPRPVSFSAAGSPNQPTGLSVTPGNSQVTVAFTPPSSNGGKAISK